jgi:hypothetical protein
MESKENITNISILVASLTQKVLMLQEKLDFLCRSTGNCDLIKKVHGDIIPNATENTTKAGSNGADINTFCEEE